MTRERDAGSPRFPLRRPGHPAPMSTARRKLCVRSIAVAIATAAMALVAAGCGPTPTNTNQSGPGHPTQETGTTLHD